jgi:transposase InsO family protein
MIDNYSRHTWVYFLKQKFETLSKFQEFCASMLSLTGMKVKSLRTDRGGEFMSGEFQQYCRDQGIHRQLTQPDTPHSNGVSERKNRMLIEKARAMMHHSQVPSFLWAEAVNTVNYMTNLSPTRSNFGGTPAGRFFGTTPSVAHLHVWRCLAYVHVEQKYRSKLDAKSISGLLVGYDT